jgi:hypothetical protein
MPIKEGEGGGMIDRARDKAEAEAAENTVWQRYRRKFPRDPVPMMLWQTGTFAELEPLMEGAIERGKPLTGEELWAAQGFPPPPADAEAPWLERRRNCHG